MTIQIEYETERKLEIPYEELAEKVASHILELEECPYEISVNLVITDILTWIRMSCFLEM